MLIGDVGQHIVNVNVYLVPPQSWAWKRAEVSVAATTASALQDLVVGLPQQADRKSVV